MVIDAFSDPKESPLAYYANLSNSKEIAHAVLVGIQIFVAHSFLVRKCLVTTWFLLWFIFAQGMPVLYCVG
jgi:hypothetical protein